MKSKIDNLIKNLKGLADKYGARKGIREQGRERGVFIKVFTR